MNPGSGIELSASGIEGSVKITLDTRLGAEQISPAPEIPMAFLRRRKRKRPIRDAANEAAETMDTAEDAIKVLRPQIEAAIIKVCSLTDHTHSMLADMRPLVLATLGQAVETLVWVRSVKGWHRVIHWRNIFYPSRWGKPFTTVELIFEEVT